MEGGRCRRTVAEADGPCRVMAVEAERLPWEVAWRDDRLDLVAGARAEDSVVAGTLPWAEVVGTAVAGDTAAAIEKV